MAAEARRSCNYSVVLEAKDSAVFEEDTGSAGLVGSTGYFLRREAELDMRGFAVRKQGRAGRRRLLKVERHTKTGLAVHTVRELAIRKPGGFVELAPVNMKEPLDVNLRIDYLVAQKSLD